VRSGEADARADIDHRAAADTTNVAEHPDEHSADGRAEQAQGERAQHLLERVGFAEPRLRHELGQDRVAGGVEEGLGATVDGDDHHHLPQAQLTARCQQAEQAEQHRAHDVGDQHHLATPVAVADDAAEQQQRDQRHRHRDSEQRQRGRSVRERVGLPRHRHEERPVTEQ
jgi:hypothetical protein